MFSPVLFLAVKRSTKWDWLVGGQSKGKNRGRETETSVAELKLKRNQ